jgi:hypothetical protein
VEKMATSFAEATQTLLGGKRLAWDKSGEHKGGSVTFANVQQRRLFAYLLAHDAANVAQGNEELFAGLIATWKQVDADSAAEGMEKRTALGPTLGVSIGLKHPDLAGSRSLVAKHLT